jgi:hypothetical protein
VDDALDAAADSLLMDGEFRPVFIMGQHRSGTTILYKLLADTDLFNVTTAYHVLNRDRLLALHAAGEEAQAREELTRRFEASGLRDREFDSIKITPDIPEEYAYALDHQGPRPQLSPRNLDGFQRFCRTITVTQDPARPLLLKNPFDADNFLYMQEALPAAVFIYIHRDPVDVVSSQVRANRSLLEKKNEYVALVVDRYRRLYERPMKRGLVRFLCSDRFPLLVDQVARIVARVNDHVLARGGEMGERCFNLTYAELCAAPAKTISAILEFLGWRDVPQRDYAGLVEPRRSAPLPEVEARRDRIRDRNAEYCRRFGV